jgi:hypothetical protein
LDIFNRKLKNRIYFYASYFYLGGADQNLKRNTERRCLGYAAIECSDDGVQLSTANCGRPSFWPRLCLVAIPSTPSF